MPDDLVPDSPPAEEEILGDVEALHEQISLQSELRDEEILECLQRLEHSEPTNPPQENPVTQAMIADLSALKTDLAELKGMLTSLQVSLETLKHSSPPPSRSDEPKPQSEVINLAEPSPDESLN